VASVVADYLDAAHAKGFTEVRLIHGRGIGVQRKIVQGVLARHPLGAGATIVRLRPRAR
jgi:dsDNA-specific endonuclease/ATPase MutS2